MYIVIREFKSNDKLQANEVLKEGILSNLPTAFWTACTREITFQLVVLTAAIMFIFLGVPFLLCILALPLVLLIIYLSIYASHLMRVAEYHQGPVSKYCWVAEALEPYFFTQNPKDIAYTIISENDTSFKKLDMGSYQRKIIGTVSVDRHRNRHYSAWLHKLAVDTKYRRKGVGSALILTAVKFCETEKYETIECASSECQLPARQLILNSGFQLMQMYHKKLAFASLEKYHMGLELCLPSNTDELIR